MTVDTDLEHWLRLWARWMRWHEVDGDYPPTASGFGGAVSNFAVSEEDARDYYETRVQPGIIQAIDAAIDSLPLSQRQAIWRHYGLTKIEPAGCTGFPEAFAAVRVLVLARVAIAA
jgi:hypothetical protein